MAVQEINKNGGFQVNGVTYRFELKALDDRYQPSETAINAKKLVERFQAPIVFVPHSGGILALQEFNETSGFIIAAYTSVPEVTESGNKLTIQLPNSYDNYVEPFTTYGMDTYGPKLAMLPTNSAYGKSWTKLMEKGWTKRGGSIVAKIFLDYNNDTSFSAAVSKALAQNPDVLFIGGPSEPTALVVKEARQHGFSGGFIIMEQAKFKEMARVLGSLKPLNGSIGVMPLIHMANPHTKTFIQKYREKYQEAPGDEAAYNYMAVYVFKKAMQLAGTVTDVKAIREHVEEAMEKLPLKYQPHKLLGLDSKGGWMTEIVLGIVEDGEIRPLVVKRDDS